MRQAALACVLLALGAVSADAQGRGRNAQGIPPGQLPRAGECRVWYDHLPPGRQPRATSCDRAERIASRDRDARVIYGDDYYGARHNERRDRNRGIYDRGYPNDRYAYNRVPYDNGYRDGLEKGREDAGDRDSYDPVRHSWYRKADRGYNHRYGTRDAYKLAYRDGFEAGYDEAYRRLRGYGANGARRGVRIPRF
jgi:hypothetical protein